MPTQWYTINNCYFTNESMLYRRRLYIWVIQFPLKKESCYRPHSVKSKVKSWFWPFSLWCFTMYPSRFFFLAVPVPFLNCNLIWNLVIRTDGSIINETATRIKTWAYFIMIKHDKETMMHGFFSLLLFLFILFLLHDYWLLGMMDKMTVVTMVSITSQWLHYKD